MSERLRFKSIAFNTVSFLAHFTPKLELRKTIFQPDEAEPLKAQGRDQASISELAL